jgi:hypothetical protein
VAANFFTHMSDEIARSPSAAGRPVRVFCLVVRGWHQPQQAMALAYFVSLGASLDLVINIDGFNETGVAIGQAGAYSVLYPRDWPALTNGLPTPTRRETGGEIVALEAARRVWARTSASAPLSWSATIATIWRAGDDTLRRARDLRLAALEKLDSETADFRLGYGGPVGEAEAVDRVADLWAEASTMMAAVQQGRGRQYVHVLQPNQYVPGSKHLSDNERRVAYDQRQPFAGWVTAGYAALAERFDLLRARGVDFFDATMIFAAVSEDVYVDTCCHFNRRGNEILLTELLDFLRLRGAQDARE